VGEHLKPIEEKAQEISELKQEVDSSIADLFSKVGQLRISWERSIMWKIFNSRSPTSTPSLHTTFDWGVPAMGILPKPEVTATSPSTGKTVVEPSGHCIENPHRENGFGFVRIHTNLSVKGTYTDQRPIVFPNSGSGVNRQFPSVSPTSFVGKYPSSISLNGENLHLWISRCESYFEMCPLEPDRWIKVAMMHFSGSASRWFMSVEWKLKLCS
jgi:hypothetical protein